MPAPEFIRVKDNTSKHEFTIDKITLVDGLTDITSEKKPAVDRFGNPLPPKPHVLESLNSGEEDGYSGLTISKLKQEIKDRNADRDEEAQIVPESGRKPDLVAALEHDDAAGEVTEDDEPADPEEGEQDDESPTPDGDQADITEEHA